MGIPSFKKVRLKSSRFNEIEKTINSLTFHEAPHIISLDHLEDEEQALNNLELIIEKSFESFDVYPLYIITQYENSSERFRAVKSMDTIPCFFQQKIKPLNVKENQILGKIKLKQRNLYALRYSEHLKSIKDYSIGQKAIKLLYKENIFLTKLNTALDNKDVK